MAPRSRRGRRKVSSLPITVPITGVAAAFAIAVGIVGFACGFDGVGTSPLAVEPPDTSVPTEASVIPRSDAAEGDSAVPDADAGQPSCPGTQGPTMVRVGLADAGFCIDSTEVTNEQYDAFLLATAGGKVDAGIPAAGLPPRCNGLQTFGRNTAAPLDGGVKAHPVTSVPWCAAAAYCGWAGKRLCGGAINGVPDAGEWYAACSDLGTRSFPYGNTFVHGNCNEDGVVGTVESVGARPACEGGVAGLVDMSGNAAEWIDNCSGASDASACFAQGTYYGSGPSGTCAATLTYLPGQTDIATGFRCCSTAP